MKKERRTRDIILVVVIGIIVIALVGTIYYNFYYSNECETFECFQKGMAKCNKVSYVNDDLEVSWKYEIVGSREKLCIVDVELLLAKEGELGINAHTGEKMSCYYPKGIGAYPEKDLNRCTGKLKESLQEIIIDKLHKYIIDNLGQINQTINQ